MLSGNGVTQEHNLVSFVGSSGSVGGRPGFPGLTDCPAQCFLFRR